MNAPPQDDIDDALNDCAQRNDDADNKYPSASYEEGVAAGVTWTQGCSSSPMSD